MNTMKKKLISSTGDITVVNKDLIIRLNKIMKKEKKHVLLKWIILDFTSFKAIDIWYIVNTKTNEKEEVLFSKLLEFYDVLNPGEITQKEYYKEKDENTPVFKRLYNV